MPQATFQQLQQQLKKYSYLVDDDTPKPRTLIYVAGFSLDIEELDKIKGISAYEERLLYVIGLLRNPKTTVIFVTSRQIDPVIIEYYFKLFSRSVSEYQSMQQRWHQLYVGNAKTHKTLTQKVLSSKRLLAQIREHVTNPKQAVLRCFNVSAAEQELATTLGVPLFGPQQNLLTHGSKSGSRKIFKAAKLPLAVGKEDIYTMAELITAIQAIKQQRPKLKKIITKFNDSFSGVGNAVLDVSKFPKTNSAAAQYINNHLRLIESGTSRETYLKKLFSLGGIVEEWVDGSNVYSPSVQVKITPDYQVQIISTHEQLFDEVTQQVFLGARYPARKLFRSSLIQQARKIGQELARQAVIGFCSVDFIVVEQGITYKVYPVEINLRKTGTTHPFQIARLVTQGTVNQDSILHTIAGRRVYYYAFDNITSDLYQGVSPSELITIVRESGLAFDSRTHIGITLHLLGALKKYGKFGVVCIARSPKAAEQLFILLQRVLDAKLQQRKPIFAVTQTQVVNRQSIIKTFVQLAKISSPSGQEQAIRLHIRQLLVQYGLKVRVDKAGNIIAKKDGRGTTPMLLSAHMDTVQPCTQVTPVVRGNMIMSDGTSILGADNKAGITYILEALRIIHECHLEHTPLEIVFTTREEVFSQGANELDISKLKSPFGVVLDGAELGEIDYIAPYIAILNVIISGKAAHSGVEPEKGISAIQIAATAIHHMKLGRVNSTTTANVGIINGGTIRNAIPDTAHLQAEVRSLSKRRLEEQLERMHQALEHANERYGGLLDVVSRVVVQGYQFSKRDPEILRLMDYMKAVQIRPQLRQAGGGSDANVFMQRGIKTIDVGTGVQKPHTTEERIKIDDMIKMVELVLEMITHK